MSERTVRVKLQFDFTPANYARKCWFVFNRDQCRLVKDVAHLISSHFSLRSIQLYIEDYLVPINETVQAIRDGDLIQVKTSPGCSFSDSSSSSSDEAPPAKRAKTTFTKAPTAPVAKKLIAVTKKSASGALHTKFHTSSSSSSSSSSSDSSSSSEGSDQSPTLKTKSEPLASRPKTQWDIQKPKFEKKRSPQEKVQSLLKKKNITNTSVAKRIAANLNRRGKGLGRRNIVTGAIVGGPMDVLTTRSKVYGGRGRVRGRGSGVCERVETVGAAERKGEQAGGGEKGEEEEEGEGTEDMEAQADKSASEGSLSEDVKAPPVELKDYSTFPDLQGPPRVGDKLAFKILELSSSYTPEVSQYKEATVVDLDSTTNTVRLKYSDDTLLRMANKSSDNSSGKFSLEQSPTSATEGDSLEVSEEVSLPVSELLQPKLVE